MKKSADFIFNSEVIQSKKHIESGFKRIDRFTLILTDSELGRISFNG